MERRDFIKTAGATTLAMMTMGSMSSCSSSVSTKSKVYITTDISGQGLLSLYKALGKQISGKVAIKMHWGEPGNVNYLRPEIIRNLCTTVNATLVDSNVYYNSPRQTSEGNRQAAIDHGYTYAPIDILDEEGEVRLPVNGGKHLTEAILGSHIMNYDCILSVAHFKGHAMAGYGGTFKNLAIGIASVAGKEAIHTLGTGTGEWSCTGELFLDKIIEYNKALMDVKGSNMLYFNILNNISTLCDCDANAPLSKMSDIGMLASLDPVALDKASLDQIYARPETERHDIVERIESVNGGYQVICAEKMGLGSQQYELIELPLP
ncbi:MAG: DUF362 domain-containing protein [Bacteroidales bacterium]|jgi:uncharacterized Fe-S center protein|nr:DUF362 domain-containing protein [Bacteroidales bacterium]